MNNALSLALPTDGVIAINGDAVTGTDRDQGIDECTDSEDEFADFVGRIFGQNPAVESTYL